MPDNEFRTLSPTRASVRVFKMSDAPYLRMYVIKSHLDFFSFISNSNNFHFLSAVYQVHTITHCKDE